MKKQERFLEEKILEEYKNYVSIFETFHEKYKIEKGYTTKYAQEYLRVLLKMTELKGLVRAAQILNLKPTYTSQEISLNERMNTLFDIFTSLLKNEEELKNGYKRISKNYKEVIDDFLKKRDIPKENSEQ